MTPSYFGNVSASSPVAGTFAPLRTVLLEPSGSASLLWHESGGRHYVQGTAAAGVHSFGGAHLSYAWEGNDTWSGFSMSNLVDPSKRSLVKHNLGSNQFLAMGDVPGESMYAVGYCAVEKACSLIFDAPVALDHVYVTNSATSCERRPLPSRSCSADSS